MPICEWPKFNPKIDTFCHSILSCRGTWDGTDFYDVFSGFGDQNHWGGSGGRRILILPVTVAPTDPTRLEGSSFPDDGVQMASRVAITRNDQRTARNGERKF